MNEFKPFSFHSTSGIYFHFISQALNYNEQNWNAMTSLKFPNITIRTLFWNSRSSYILLKFLHNKFWTKLIKNMLSIVILELCGSQNLGHFLDLIKDVFWNFCIACCRWIKFESWNSKAKCILKCKQLKRQLEDAP